MDHKKVLAAINKGREALGYSELKRLPKVDTIKWMENASSNCPISLALKSLVDISAIHILNPNKRKQLAKAWRTRIDEEWVYLPSVLEKFVQEFDEKMPDD